MSLIVIIGGGPAGLLAAQRLAEAGQQVQLYEAQATVGRKFLVAGHGGFNLSNGEEIKGFAKRYGTEESRFRQFLDHFSPTDLRVWAADLGIETFVGTSGRVFPNPKHKPADLLRAWLQRLRTLGVEIHTRHRWLGFAKEGGILLSDENQAPSQQFTISPQATLLALGGASWPKTGSDAAWPPFLQGIGIKVTPFAPANCGAEIAWSDFFRKKIGRAPLKNIALSVNNGPAQRGELMLTEYGLEGTPAYALTPAIRNALAVNEATVFYLNLKPDVSAEALLQKIRQPRNKASFADFLKKTLQLGAPIPTLLREIQPDVATIPTETLARLITNLPIPISGLRPLEEAISTAGGVAFSAVNEQLMLWARPGTFVAGEMLDWEAPTGGYLLQGCFSTGAWAAEGILAMLKKDG